MSRSRKKTPVVGHAADSERHDKALWHRRLRAREREAFANGTEMPDIKDVSNPWYLGKDGRSRVEPGSKLTRK
jgi:hypothetical protein